MTIEKQSVINIRQRYRWLSAWVLFRMRLEDWYFCFTKQYSQWCWRRRVSAVDYAIVVDQWPALAADSPLDQARAKAIHKEINHLERSWALKCAEGSHADT